MAGAQADAPVERIFRGGPILTVEEGEPVAEALAMGGGRILAVGPEAEVMALATPGTVIHDLEGATIVPGFIDSHGHFMNAPQLVAWANVSGPPAGPSTSIAGVVAELKAHAERRGIPEGAWVIGSGYDPTLYSDGREMTRDDIDAVLPDHPVLVLHVSNHGCVLNSRGFEIFGIDETTPTPEGGIIARKEGTNVPAGLLMETAFIPIFARLPKPTEEELMEALVEGQTFYTSRGVTTAQEGATHKAELEVLIRAADQGRLRIDVVSLPLVLEFPALIAEYAPTFRGAGRWSCPRRRPRPSAPTRNRLKLQGVKIALDGSPQGKTAFWTEPLLTGGPEGEEDWVGFPLAPPEVVTPVVAEFVDKGVQIFTHANGDAAIDMVIDAAWQIFEEDTKGSLAPGKLADLVILDRNPLEVEPDELLNIQVVETFKEGESVWRRGA